MVRKRRLGGSLIRVDEIVQIRVEYIRVDLMLPPVESGKQGQIAGCGVEMRPKANIAVLIYVAGF